MVKVLGIVGSARGRGGVTDFAIKEALKAAEEEGAETETIYLAEKDIQHCDICGECSKEKKGKCHFDDDMQSIFEKMVEADGIILGAPVYNSSAPSKVKALQERAWMLINNSGKRLLENKVGGPIVVGNRVGQVFTFYQLLFFFIINGVIFPSTTHCPVCQGRQDGVVGLDEIGLHTIRNFGKKIVLIAKNLPPLPTQSLPPVTYGAKLPLNNDE
jgi:multimeric flavodoxin WrbA